MSTNPTNFAGWLRTSADGRHWSDFRQVCQSSSEQSCWMMLLYIDGGEKYCDKRVCPEGKAPAKRKRKR